MWYYNSQNDVPVVNRTLGDSVDLAMDVIFMLCVVVGLNIHVGCECMRMYRGLRVFAHIQIKQQYPVKI
jgi:hypothetical protein